MTGLTGQGPRRDRIRRSQTRRSGEWPVTRPMRMNTKCDDFCITC